MSSRFELRHVPALDGLRGLAVAGVLLFHGGHLTGGYLGVDLFFVLSGFLITSLLLREWSGSGGIALKGFWVRRARRLLPALFGLLGGVALYCLVWAKPFELPSIRADSLATVFYVANWHAIWTGSGYWDLFTTPSPLQHTWSLAIEEQFYLVWPLVVLGLLRWRRGDVRPVLAVAVAGAVLSQVWMVLRYVPGADPSRVYFGTDTRAGGVLAGAALAALLAWRGPARSERGRLAVEGLALVGAVWLAWAWSNLDGQAAALYRGGFALSALAVVAVIAAAAHPDRGRIGAVLSFPPFRALGLISYGLYLWHWPVFTVLRLEHDHLLGGLDTGSWLFFALQVAVSLAFALVSYWVIEQPIRRRGLAGWPAGRVLAPAAAALSVVLVLLATTGGETRPEFAYAGTAADPTAATLGTLPVAVDDPVGVGGRLGTLPGSSVPGDGTSDALAPGSGPAPTGVAPTTTSVPTAGPITRPAGRPGRVLVVGDSVGYYLGEGLQRQQASLGLQVGQRAMFKCTLGRQFGVWRRQGQVPDDPENADCRSWPRLWGDAVGTFKPDAVLFLFGGPPQGQLQIDGQWRAPCDPEFHAYWRQETEAAVQVLGAGGAVVYLTPAAHPRFPFLPDDIDQRTDCVNAVYREVAAAHPGTVRILPLDEWTCPAGQCRDRVDGVELREDGIHYRGAAADLAARWVATQLFAP